MKINKKIKNHKCRILALLLALSLCLNFNISVYGAGEQETEIIPTDVDTPASGNLFIEVEGTYSSAEKEEVLARINEIREEAYDLGLVSEYNPIKWSSSLERIARLRAAEATVYMAHTRTNGKSCFSLIYDGQQSWGENLAWNFSTSAMMRAIEQWYSEKEDYIKMVEGDDTITYSDIGHYQNMIKQQYTYVGLGTFQFSTGGWITTAQEFGYVSEDETKLDTLGNCVQLMEIAGAVVTDLSISGKNSISPEETTDLSVNATVSYNFNSYPVNDGLTWSSSDESVATVENGIVTGIGNGTATITAKIIGAEDVQATFEITVTDEEPVIPDPVDPDPVDPDPVEKVSDIFIDVAEGSWYEEAVQYVYDKGLMEGNGDKFTPNGQMTRGMFVTTLYRLAGEPEITDDKALTELNDVAEGAWYADAVCWAYATGVTTGYENDMTFRTNVALSREQLATFLYRYTQYQELDVSASDDLEGLLNADKVKPYAEKEVKWAVGAGMLSGMEVKNEAGETVYDLAPQKTATRAQMAQILMRFCEAYEL